MCEATGWHRTGDYEQELMIFTRQRRVQSDAESLFTVFRHPRCKRGPCSLGGSVLLIRDFERVLPNRRTVSVQYCMSELCFNVFNLGLITFKRESVVNREVNDKCVLFFFLPFLTRFIRELEKGVWNWRDLFFSLRVACEKKSLFFAFSKRAKASARW